MAYDPDNVCGKATTPPGRLEEHVPAESFGKSTGLDGKKGDTRRFYIVEVNGRLTLEIYDFG